MTMTPIKTNELLAYIAGFFDGEGSVGVYCGTKKRSQSYLRSQLKQNACAISDLIFEDLFKLYGGSLSKIKTSSGKTHINWQVSGDKCVIFLKDILPYSRLKKEQIVLGIEWQEGRCKVERDGSGKICSKLESEISRDIDFSNRIRGLKTNPLGSPYPI